MTAQALVLAKAGVSASGRDWMWSLFSQSWTGNGPALRLSQHQAQGILVLLHSDAGLTIITPPNHFLAVECSVAWLDLLDAIPADILLLGCNTGEISRQTLSFSSQAQQIHSKKLLCSASRVYTAVQSLY